MKNNPLLKFSKKGIYCALADVYIDAWRPVEKVIITHGHADHSRKGHNKYISHHLSLPILKHRLGNIQINGVNWGETFTINGVKFSLHPAGHIIGSSQVRVEHKGEIWVYSGDYKIEDDGISTPFEPIQCHSFITECTFGLPVFKWNPQTTIYKEINNWWKENKKNKQASVIYVYSLGKAQRVLKNLEVETGKIFATTAIHNLTNVLRTNFVFPETIPFHKTIAKEELEGSIVLSTPNAQSNSLLNKNIPLKSAAASGWMATRGTRRRRALDKGFVLSDHADWEGLLSAVQSTSCQKVICTHGYTDVFAKYLRTLGYDATTEKTQYEE